MSETTYEKKRRLEEEARRKRSSGSSYSPVGYSNDFRIGNGDVDLGSNDAGTCGDAGGGGVSGGSCD